MQNVRKTQGMRSDMDYQCVCEDSRTRVYLSLVPSEKIRKQRRKEKVWAFRKALNIVLGPVAAVIAQMLMTIGVTLLTYELLAAKLYEIRGGYTIGSEFFFAACVGIMTFKLSNMIFRKWR